MAIEKKNKGTLPDTLAEPSDISDFSDDYSLNEDDIDNVLIPQSSTSETSGESRAGDNDTCSNRYIFI